MVSGNLCAWLMVTISELTTIVLLFQILWGRC
jgi:hypothetical protein